MKLPLSAAQILEEFLKQTLLHGLHTFRSAAHTIQKFMAPKQLKHVSHCHPMKVENNPVTVVLFEAHFNPPAGGRGPPTKSNLERKTSGAYTW
jgi:hypothetical protein